MKTPPDAGFTMMELMVVMIVGAIIFAITIPAFKHFSGTNDLASSARAIATQLSLAREKSISTGNTQTMRFIKDYQSTSDYHIWSNNVASPSWKLPKGITYYWGTGTQNQYRMTSDGRCLDSGFVILQNDAGDRDTVSVRLSGLIIVY
jgi:prepilin-type N-terminal cleavage/methylation domain-containing protein